MYIRRGRVVSLVVIHIGEMATYVNVFDKFAHLFVYLWGGAAPLWLVGFVSPLRWHRSRCFRSKWIPNLATASIPRYGAFFGLQIYYVTIGMALILKVQFFRRIELLYDESTSIVGPKFHRNELSTRQKPLALRRYFRRETAKKYSSSLKGENLHKAKEFFSFYIFRDSVFINARRRAATVPTTVTAVAVVVRVNEFIQTNICFRR